MAASDDVAFERVAVVERLLEWVLDLRLRSPSATRTTSRPRHSTLPPLTSRQRTACSGWHRTKSISPSIAPLARVARHPADRVIGLPWLGELVAEHLEHLALAVALDLIREQLSREHLRHQPRPQSATRSSAAASLPQSTCETCACQDRRTPVRPVHHGASPNIDSRTGSAGSRDGSHFDRVLIVGDVRTLHEPKRLGLPAAHGRRSDGAPSGCYVGAVECRRRAGRCCASSVKVSEHPRYGRQVIVSELHPSEPTEADLSSLLAGPGEKPAELEQQLDS